ncbi:hypothetical protein TNCV_1900381 [Trichonephila clavipes]|nr:hypothetical protein TNCV_1900381 [Trichonephila clavipes]
MSLNLQWMEEVSSIQRRYYTFRKQKVNHCTPSLHGVDQKWTAMLNDLLHYSNDNEGRARCIKVLPTTLPSELDASVFAKPWKEKLQKFPDFLTLTLS